MHELHLKEVWPFLFVGARLFGLFSFMPGFSHLAVPFPVRVFMTAALSGAITMIIYPEALQIPENKILLKIIQEIATGILSGLLLKVFFSALDIAGSICGFQMSLSNVFINNPDTNQQNSMLSSFFILIAITILFATNMHLHILSVFVDSFHKTDVSSINDYSKIFLEIFSSAFAVGLSLAGPAIIVSVTLYFVAGILNRLVPQVQVFFLIQPLQLFLGFWFLALVLPLTFERFIELLTDAVHNWGSDL
jgi:flagellar biosynthetic protein FliR